MNEFLLLLNCITGSEENYASHSLPVNMAPFSKEDKMLKFVWM